MNSGPLNPPEQSELRPDEYVYRRIAENNARQGYIREGRIDQAAFLPNKGDARGLSLIRAQTPEEAAATGKAGKRFFVLLVFS
jgi:hypothetical protein